MSNFGSIFKGALKGFVMSGGSPLGAGAGAVSERKKERAILKAEIAQQDYLRRQQEMQQYGSGEFASTGLTFSNTGTQPQSQGFGAGFGTFLSDVGRNIISPFAGIAKQVAPFFTTSSRQQPAINTTGNIGAQESQSSGSIQGFTGVPALVPAFRGLSKIIKSPTGSLVTGTGLGGALTMLGDDGKPVRITRKMKAQFRSVLNLAGGNYQMAADMIGVSDDFFIAVMLKRFRNDGPVVTKAALRKTKQTVRRLKSMCDMYDSLRPTATRRRSPMKRASTTLISNK
jgi:hypothetical protein